MNSQGIVWAGIYVENLPAATAYYRDILGLHLLRQGEVWAQFDTGGGGLLELMAGGIASPIAKQTDRQPLVIGFLVDDLEQTVGELGGRGVTFLGEVGSYKNQSWAHFCDLEGNRLEIKEILPK